MMKRLIALLLTAALLCSSCAALAEDTGNSLWNPLAEAVTNWLNSEQTQGAWNSASQWAEDAWNGASGWFSEAWDTASPWVTEIWGDVSEWAGETYSDAAEALSAWWNDSLSQITFGGAWDWLKASAANYTAQAKEWLGQVVSSADTDAAEQAVRDTFEMLTEQLKLTAEEADKVWASVQAWAKENGITAENAAKLALPYLLQLVTSDSAAKLPAVAVARFLTGVLDKLGVSSDEEVNALLLQLKDAAAAVQ